MSTLQLKIVTPEKEIYSGDVEMVTAQTKDGEIGILPHHTNLMTQIVPGELKIKKGSQIIYLATGNGLLQMADNQLSIMTDLAEEAEEINEKAAEEAKNRAQAALEQKLTVEEYATTLATLEKSLAQLKVKRRHRIR